ncbi:hypothetical protein AAS23_gp41 [Pantoea phage vB_PagS_AAS23]|uniref:Uncharacterized protein n=1 Tax=Pantoea phage vB_PagS_AAS23 TaxID=2499073 RepID=A0A3S9U7R2_9CAUD|nr:hypothetical protein HOU93_gp41 [Pantoea phage vB_PagS_AAS23]AZS06354.1 hypothetical protein AAS23_gp41 [Pantoea phage vB_PagS_AAS23]
MLKLRRWGGLILPHRNKQSTQGNQHEKLYEQADFYSDLHRPGHDGYCWFCVGYPPGFKF